MPAGTAALRMGGKQGWAEGQGGLPCRCHQGLSHAHRKLGSWMAPWTCAKLRPEEREQAFLPPLQPTFGSGLLFGVGVTLGQVAPLRRGEGPDRGTLETSEATLWAAGGTAVWGSSEGLWAAHHGTPCTLGCGCGGSVRSCWIQYGRCKKSQRWFLHTEGLPGFGFCRVRSTRPLWLGWGLPGMISPTDPFPCTQHIPQQCPTPHGAPWFSTLHRIPGRTRGHPAPR